MQITKPHFLFVLLAIVTAPSAFAADSTEGAALYTERCAICHDRAEDYTPPKSTFAFRSAEFVVDALTSGAMQPQADGLSEEQIEQIAIHVTGKTLNPDRPLLTDRWDINYCAEKPAPVTADQFYWNGWGRAADGKRYQPQPGFTAADVPKLKVKWAFAYPGGRTNVQPVVVGDRLLVASRPGMVFSLDAKTGCTHWAFEPEGGVRAALSVGPVPGSEPLRYAAYMGTGNRDVIAVDLDTGKELWKTNIEQHPVARVTGSPIIAGDRLIVPLSSGEEGAGRNEDYECCTFRGSLVALDIKTGDILWKTYTIDEAPKPFRISEAGTQMHGPAGAAIWSAPSYDTSRKLIYAATGDSYTDVVENGSDAVVAFDWKNGDIVWRNQVTEQDNYIIGCLNVRTHANCPEIMGPDYDFGSTPIIHHYRDEHGEGKTLLLTGQKSGIIYAMDPDRGGEIVWQQQPGVGSVRGGIQWGPAADENNVYVAVSDSVAQPDNRKPGLTAFDIVNGEQLWHATAPPGECSDASGRMTCDNGLSAAVTVMPGAVFAGSLNGIFRSHATGDGRVIWQVDMNRVQVDSVNNLTVRGGAMDATGAAIANGLLYINAGYGGVPGQPGNVLLAFSVNGE